MSAIQQLSVDPGNRRRAERLLVAGTVNVIFGRGSGVLVDLSHHGARIRHSAPVRRGASVRISFESAHARFSADAEVLAARVIGLGTGPSYESRIRFTSLDAPSERVLATAIEELTERDIRRWVANLKGWSDEPQSPVAKPTGFFIRCRLRGEWWDRKCTSDTTQPADGFLLPSGSTEAEIVTLCDTYSRSDEDRRRTIRLMAAAAVDHSLGVF